MSENSFEGDNDTEGAPTALTKQPTWWCKSFEEPTLVGAMFSYLEDAKLSLHARRRAGAS